MKKAVMLFADVINAVISIFFAPVVALQAKVGPERLRFTYRVWDKFNLSPIRYHYYQPIFNVNNLPCDLWEVKDPLHGIDWNECGQIKLLQSFDYQDELVAVSTTVTSDLLEFYHNQSFGPADAEMLYNIVRRHKPSRVVEVGSGHSTKMMKRALDVNRSEGVGAKHICIEPYEMPWLESLGVDEILRKRVEDVELSLFDSLGENDILFIDSSHVVRTGGDVCFEYLRILPMLKPGVLVHIHDVFLPYEYPKNWVIDKRRYWTEQYILQAFLAFNSSFEIVAAVHWLAEEHGNELANVCPVYGKQKRGAGSFWIRRIE